MVLSLDLFSMGIFLLCSSATSVYLTDLMTDGQVSRRAGMHTEPYLELGIVGVGTL